MKKFLLGILCGVVLAGLIGIIMVFAAIRIGDRRPAVAVDSTLVLRLAGDIPERAPVEISIPFFEDAGSPTVLETWQALNRAAQDPKIKAVVLEPRGIRTGWGKLQELHGAIEKFKQSGKPVYAFLYSPHTADYYLASAADKIFISHDDMLNLKGLRVEEMYLKNALDKLGVKIEIEHAGRYKDYGDQYSRTSMTPETREVLNSFLDEWFSDLVTVIAHGRRRTPGEIARMIDDGPFLAPKARDLGLIDSLGYEDEAYSQLKDKLKLKSIKKVSLRDYVRSAPAQKEKTRIAMLVAEGGISGANNADQTDEITAAGMIKLMKQVENDDSIKGVIFRVNSPGGDAIASDEILHQAKLLAKKKPMVISMSDYAASGGYMVSMTGDPVIAYPGTITGSIGVVFGKVNLRGLYDKIGISKETLKRGRFADIDSESTSLDPAERQKLREGIEATYKSFVSSVAEGRKRKFEEVEPLSQGRAWTGKQAIEHGLVDESGGLETAINAIKKRIKIGDKDKVAIVPFPERRSIFEQLSSRNEESASGDAELRVVLRRLIPDTQMRSWTKVFINGGMLRVMPYTITVR
jgi:protease-4